MKRVLILLALLLAGLIAAIASDRPLPPADFTYITPVDFFTLDPQRMSYHQDLRLAYSIYEALVRWDNRTFEIVPGVAESWEVSPDGLVYTFRLRPDARWSTGEPVTAADFRDSWRRAVMPDTASDYSALFFRIRGAEAFFRWRTAQLEEYGAAPEPRKSMARAREILEEAERRFLETVAIEAVDPGTLRVTLERPTAYFLDLCAFGPFSPVHQPTVRDPKWFGVDPGSGRIRQRYGWTKPPHLVTNGPYVVKSWRFKREIYLERNPHYWNPAAVKPDTVKGVPIEEPNTGVLAFQTGAADWHADVRVEYTSELLRETESGDRDDFHSIGTFGTYFWNFNCTPALSDGRPNPFHDARVRRAFVLAIDKELIARNVRRSGEQPARVLIPPGSIAGFRSPEGLAHDPARAVRELESAGWKDRDGDGVLENESGAPFPTVELLYSTSGYHRDIGLAMARMWEQTLGVRTKMVGKEAKIYKDDLKRRDYMVARGGWFGDYGDPTTFLDLHKTGDGNNDRGYSNPAFDALLERADNEPDPDARMRILEEAERLTMEEELPILPLFQYNWYFMYKPPTRPDGSPNPGGLRGMSDHPRNVQYLWQLEVVPGPEEAAR